MRRNVRIQFDGNRKIYEFKNPLHIEFEAGDRIYVRNANGHVEEVTVYDDKSSNHKRKSSAYPAPRYFNKLNLLKSVPVLPNI